jgi:hypothetical protein
LATAKVPVTPVVNGKPVALVNTIADGVPNAGVIKVGEVDNTTLPVPVDVVTPVPPLATAMVPDILPEFTVDETDGIFKVVPDKVAAPVPVVVKVNDAVGALPYPWPTFQ